MQHPILEGVPEGRVREHLRLIGARTRRVVGGAAAEGRRHQVCEAVHEIREVPLSDFAENLAAMVTELVRRGLIKVTPSVEDSRAGIYLLWDFLAVGFMVSGPNHCHRE